MLVKRGGGRGWLQRARPALAPHRLVSAKGPTSFEFHRRPQGYQQAESPAPTSSQPLRVQPNFRGPGQVPTEWMLLLLCHPGDPISSGIHAL